MNRPFAHINIFSLIKQHEKTERDEKKKLTSNTRDKKTFIQVFPVYFRTAIAESIREMGEGEEEKSIILVYAGIKTQHEY